MVGITLCILRRSSTSTRPPPHTHTHTTRSSVYLYRVIQLTPTSKGKCMTTEYSGAYWYTTAHRSETILCNTLHINITQHTCRKFTPWETMD